MKKVRLALVGAGGYGDYCLGLMERFVDPDTYALVAAIDPFYERVPRFEKLKAQGVPFYRTLEDFFAADTADLVLIASPIHMHREQCILAMQHGAHVLCEKPLAPIVQDALAIRDAAEKYGKKLGVGFQMSFCDPIQNLKKDIRAGLLGAPKSLRSYVSWQRFDSYYNSPWKGRVRDAQGHWILDSILTNATAHYLHNTFFVLGSEQDSAAMPQSLRVELYNGKGIETFDTAFVQGEFADGSDFFIAVTHSGDRNIDPVLRYEFENAVVTASGNDDSAEIIATFRDGTTKNYGAALGEYHVAQKIRTMLAVAADPSLSVPCTADTILPQLTVCNAICDQADVHLLPVARMERVSEPEPGVFMPGLSDAAWRCFEEGKLPSALGYDWACPPSEIRLDGYTAFSGARFDKEAN
nr:Gfo/Idh/MocA family oxidoreductase [uncultured Agathobaculum sp.]